jgi:hypothetical protein
MSIPECPHCHRRVIPSSSGECPSCGKNVTDEVALSQKMRALAIRGDHVFPPFCFNCGEPARNHRKIVITNVDVFQRIRWAVWTYLIPFGKYLAAARAERYKTIRLEVPICETCRKAKIWPEVQSFDLDERETRLIVHERFRERVVRKEPEIVPAT